MYFSILLYFFACKISTIFNCWACSSYSIYILLLSCSWLSSFLKAAWAAPPSALIFSISTSCNMSIWQHILDKATAKGRLEFVRSLLEIDDNINNETMVSSISCITELYRLYRRCHSFASIGWLMLFCFVYVMRSKNGMNELALASCCGDLDVVRSLIENGANIHHQNIVSYSQ